MDFGICQKISSYITRPPRTRYHIDDLGPQRFHIRSNEYQRVDFTVINERHLKVQCSLFRGIFQKTQYQKANYNKQTVIFLHANSSSRLAAKNYLADLLPFFNVACLDCSGSGNSEGDVVTLGYYEKQDLRVLIKTLREKYGAKGIFLWGRSMGAVTAILYAAKYDDLLGVVADNAFSDLQLTCKELKNNYCPIFPDFLLDALISQVQQHIETNINKPLKLQFSIQKLKPIQTVKKINCPIFYIYSESDKIVANYHTKKLYEESNYPKRIMSVKGDHNGIRDVDIKGKVVDYLLEIVVQNKKRNQKINDDIGNYQNNDFAKKSQAKRKSFRFNQQATDKSQNLQYESPFNEMLCRSYLNNSKDIEKQRKRQQHQQQESIKSVTNLKTLKIASYNDDSSTVNTSEFRRRFSLIPDAVVKQSIINNMVESNTINSKRKRKRIFD